MASKPLDVWFKFYEPANEDDGEASTYRSGNGYVIESYHNEVGQVAEEYFDTIGAAHEWYATNGYEDYSS